MEQEDLCRQAHVEGGVSIFDDLLKPDRTKAEVGQEPIPSPEGAREYVRKLESIEESRRLGELALQDKDEDSLAAA